MIPSSSSTGRSSRFAAIDGAGHFLDLESRQSRALARTAILNFLEVPITESGISPAVACRAPAAVSRAASAFQTLLAAES